MECRASIDQLNSMSMPQQMELSQILTQQLESLTQELCDELTQMNQLPTPSHLSSSQPPDDLLSIEQ